MVRSALSALLVVLAGPAIAQSSIGITGGMVDLGLSHGEGGESTKAEAVIDVAVTGAHGFQGDIAYQEMRGGGIGGLGAHLFLRPAPDRKYGLFATLSDVDGRALAWGSVGAEGMIALGDNTALEARAGIGAADDGLDYIFGGAAVSRALSTNFDIEAFVDVADFDEPALRVTGWEAGLNLRYSPEGSPWGIEAGFSRSGFAGRDAVSADNRITLGVTFAFGTAGGVSPQTRPFRRHDPVAPLLRRGLW